jgi:hypothetical protein
VLPALASDREFVEMFLAEARIAATLDHPNVVQVHDLGRDADGPYFAMELLHGADAGDLLRTTQDTPGGTVGLPEDGASDRPSPGSLYGGRRFAPPGIPLGISLEIVRGAAAGLHYAHERTSGLVHRDVSPQNIFVTLDGAVKLLDWGIAKAVERISNHYTRSGTLRGKIPYMSPEQCRGETLDRRSDVFSLAVVLWEMTVGERLFGAGAQSDFDVLKQIIETDAPRPSQRRADYPPALERIVMKGLARDVRARHQTADELLVELETFMRGSSLWMTARDLAAFMVRTYPDRVAKRDTERAADHEATGGRIVPFPGKRTVELPIEAAVAPTVPSTPIAPAVPAATAPVASKSPRRWFVAGAVLGVAGAVALGFALGRGSAPATASEPSAGTASGSPAPARVREPITEDTHWFQQDDYLISKKAYQGDKLVGLRPAKVLRPPSRPQADARFLDATGKEVETATYWQTRPATPEDLEIGKLAFCMAESYAKVGARPPSKTASRQTPWIAARVTDIAELDAGKVTIGDVVCPVTGVRVAGR